MTATCIPVKPAGQFPRRAAWGGRVHVAERWCGRLVVQLQAVNGACGSIPLLPSLGKGDTQLNAVTPVTTGINMTTILCMTMAAPLRAWLDGELWSAEPA